MSRTKPFIVQVSVAREIVGEPWCADYVVGVLGRPREALGPRGGKYRLGPIVRVQSSEAAGWCHSEIVYRARRIGAYVRPRRSA